MEKKKGLKLKILGFLYLCPKTYHRGQAPMIGFGGETKAQWMMVIE